MKLTVFGATGQTGKEIVRQALEAGHEVTALVRDRAKLADMSSKVRIVQGDSMDIIAVEDSVAGTEAVLSVLGQVRNSPPDLLAKSAWNIVEAMKKRNVRRIVVLTNVAARDPSDHPSLYNRFLRALLILFRGPMARDTVREAQTISESGLDWTIVRASLLTNDPPSKKYRAGELDRKTGTRVSRANVAAFMIACVAENKYIRAKPVVSE